MASKSQLCSDQAQRGQITHDQIPGQPTSRPNVAKTRQISEKRFGELFREVAASTRKRAPLPTSAEQRAQMASQLQKFARLVRSINRCMKIYRRIPHSEAGVKAVLKVHSILVQQVNLTSATLLEPTVLTVKELEYCLVFFQRMVNFIFKQIKCLRCYTRLFS